MKREKNFIKLGHNPKNFCQNLGEFGKNRTTLVNFYFLVVFQIVIYRDRTKQRTPVFTPPPPPHCVLNGVLCGHFLGIKM